LLSATMTVEIVVPSSVPPEEFDRLSSRAGIFFRRGRLDWLREDPRWLDLLAAVRCGDRLVGLLPIAVCRATRWYDPLYDPPALTGEARYAPSGTCLIGGRADLHASMLFDPALDQSQRYEAAEHAVDSAQEWARKEGRRCVALYVAAEEAELGMALSGAGMTSRPAPGRHVIRWPEPTLGSYLASLTRTRRRNVRADWRTRDNLGLETKVTDWESVIAPAAPLINVTLVNHGYASRSELVRMRLRRWNEVIGDSGFALCAMASGRCTGYAFCWQDGNRVTVQDVAFERGSAAVHRASYLELLIYGPLAVCCDVGANVLDLGIYASEPKRLRGAVEEPLHLWVRQAD
jgi:hypothetical protein